MSDLTEAARVRRMEKVAEAAKALRSEHRADFMDDGARQDRLYELFQLLDEHDEAAALAELDAGGVMPMILIPFPGGWWGLGVLVIACLALGFIAALWVEDALIARDFRKMKENK